jgi:hypothetical protein
MFEGWKRHLRRQPAWLLSVSVFLLCLNAAVAANPCDFSTGNRVACENTRPGSPPSQWDLDGPADPTILGFATDISVNVGETIRFKVDTDATNYRIDIYRVGYYQGHGARLITTVLPSVPLPQVQPDPLTDSATGLVDCGNWAESASWSVPATAVSGFYIAKLVRTDTGGASHIYFVVRDDAGRSDLLFQTSDTTWIAYNAYGGRNLYDRFGTPNPRAYKVSYNRPVTTRDTLEWASLFLAEYPMIRWLEANGYDVSYTTGVDAARRGNLLLQHRVFLSVGHDEYWSGEQRANVEMARDAGLHLAFFSGNEVFWKIRWEPSVDGSSTPYRTMVCYKETKANAKIDPHPEWTGTWRDPRFSPPSDGGRPENLLTGTIFVVNGVTLSVLEVPAEYGAHRFWRNTSVATLLPGEKAIFGRGILGFEWDEVSVNGPAGQMRLSLTTVDGVPVLQDYGNTYASGQATHSLSLYRHSSGALVFGAGMVQWPWGLDDEHDKFIAPVADVRIQQATVNLFADMGTQPITLQPGLVPATPSTDLTPPTSSITNPRTGDRHQPGSLVTITGSALDLGGQLAGVEVSTDGGATWQPAVGRASWSYAWTPATPGTVSLKSRAVDDSGNLEAPSAGVTVSVPDDQLTIWPASAAPMFVDGGPDKPIQLGVKFRSDFAGSITGIRFYKGSANSGSHVANLWTTNGNLIASATFVGESSSGWQQMNFSTPVAILPNTLYVASYHCPKGHYSVNRDYFINERVSPPLYALDSKSAGGNGVYAYGSSSTFPINTYRAGNYWVDVAFEPVLAVMTASLPNGILDSEYSTTLRVIGGRKPHTWSLSTGSLPPGVRLNAATGALAGRPTATGNFEFTVQVSDSSDLRQTATKPLNVRIYAGEPLTIWPGSTVPTVADGGADSPVQLGVKFRPAVAGAITGVRFYKSPANKGRHVGSLWTSTGSLLASALFTDETSSGWQEVQFTQPVEVASNTLYVASYHCERGHYSMDFDYFSSSLNSGSLQIPSSGASGGNGVYVYGSSTAFPSQNYRAANYWVDITFQAPLSLNTVSLANGILGIPYSATLNASSGKKPYIWTISSGSLPPGLSLDSASGTIAGTASSVGTFSFTAEVSDSANPVQRISKAFTVTIYPDRPLTIWPDSAVPGSIGGTDNPVELGVKFRSDVAGVITGIRFYKFAANTGTHVGSLWTATGTLLASATFTGESQSGWQQVDFATPVEITPNALYVASYLCPKGYYGIDLNYFSAAGVDNPPLHAVISRTGTGNGNGVYAYPGGRFPSQSASAGNYWVDVAFQAPLSISTTSLPVGHVNQTYSGTLTAASGKKPYTWSISAGGLPTGLNLDPLTGEISGVPEVTGTFTFTAQVSDSVVPAQTANKAFSIQIYTPPTSIWPDTAVPEVVDAGVDSPAQLGVKFHSDTAGIITGIRFYKSIGNTGTHVGKLWSTNGTLLASAVFTSETVSGWQTVSFANPVAVTSNTIYIASYHCPGGHYSVNRTQFSTTGVANPPLHVPANNVAGGNGIYVYGSSSAFPNRSSSGANYWVDVIFSPDAAP